MRDVEIAATSGFTPTAFDGKPLPKGWPLPIHDAAFHGVAGDVVRAMSPHTEADEGALLVQLLVAFGNLVGRGAYWEAGADHHHGNLFTVVVGNTSTGRKGSGWSMISNLLHPVDPCWRDEHVKSGVSSGEGLIFAVRDPIMRRNQIREKGRVVGSEEYVEDPGVADKRLLAQEGEFANVLKVATREGNTISTWLRQAWDGTDLGTLTKAPITATRPHISMIGHITAEELRIALTHTDTLSGFANRFLWVASTRSKSLPSGGNWARANTAPLVKRLKAAADFAKEAQLTKRDVAAEAAWCDQLYDKLTADRGGLFGAATGRAEAQTMRLAMVYALLDQSPEIRIEHLHAGVQVWAYCEATARWLFGSSTGNRDADTISAGLEKAGSELNRTEIRDLFSRHISDARLDTALADLLRLGLAESTRRETRGRPAEVWRKAHSNGLQQWNYRVEHSLSAFNAYNAGGGS